MKFLVQIDRETIKKNPDGGSFGPYFVPGQLHNDGNGNKYRDCQAVYSFCPEPHYTAEYLPCEVMCENCLSRFPRNDLKLFEDEYCDEDGDEHYVSYWECPVCEQDACCTILWEHLDNEGKVYIGWQI